jgi:hypothetical protein
MASVCNVPDKSLKVISIRSRHNDPSIASLKLFFQRQKTTVNDCLGRSIYINIRQTKTYAGPTPFDPLGLILLVMIVYAMAIRLMH